MIDLKLLREQINQTDQKMIELFEKRMQLSAQIAFFKKQNNLAILDKNREEEVLQRNLAFLNDSTLENYYLIFQKQLMNLSKQYQQQLLSDDNTINMILDNNPYDIVINDRLLGNLNELFQLDRKVLLVYDDNLPKDTVKKVADQVKDVKILELHADEKLKSLDSLMMVYDSLSQGQFSRGDCIVCLAGGLISDLTALAASTFKRGIDLYLIPTTLLAMADSSIGGKNAINYAGYKNMIGTFAQPKKVLICPSLLNSLPPRQFNNGLLEIIKMAVIYDKEFFDQLANNSNLDIRQVIYQAVMIKKAIVQLDEKENHLRKLLNFGHTIGHCLELNCQNLYHGEAVGYGMLCLCSDEVFERLIKLVKPLLPAEKLSFDKEKIKAALLQDKKVKGNKIEIVYVKDIAKVEIKEVTVDYLLTRLDVLKKVNCYEK
ncbi:MAG: chorismate mutase [Erysipelotrichaceae bacterium]